MIVKDILFEDFINYQKPSTFIIFPKCNFKCCIEAKNDICQNMKVVNLPNIEISAKTIINKYLKNPISKSIVCGGLEPFDSFEDLLTLLSELRKHSDDDFVIYTGYTEEELVDKIKILQKFKNVIVKFGRFVPNQPSHFDEILGVNLASPNQYAKKIS